MTILSDEPSGSLTSQAQPEPKTVAARFSNSCWKASRVLKVCSMAVWRSVGMVVLGLRFFQKKLWLLWPPPWSFLG